jgi:hypothetical protein
MFNGSTSQLAVSAVSSADADEYEDEDEDGYGDAEDWAAPSAGRGGAPAPSATSPA